MSKVGKAIVFPFMAVSMSYSSAYQINETIKEMVVLEKNPSTVIQSICFLLYFFPWSLFIIYIQSMK